MNAMMFCAKVDYAVEESIIGDRVGGGMPMYGMNDVARIRPMCSHESRKVGIHPNWIRRNAMDDE